jgi:hypothetical protein
MHAKLHKDTDSLLQHLPNFTGLIKHVHLYICIYTVFVIHSHRSCFSCLYCFDCTDMCSISFRMCADCHLPGTLCMWTDCTTCFEGCATTAGECGGCLGGAGEAGLPLLLIMGVIVLGLFTVIGIFYSVLVATMVGQRIWQRHYHILAKRMLTKVSTTVYSSAGVRHSVSSTMVFTHVWCQYLPGVCRRGCRW